MLLLRDFSLLYSSTFSLILFLFLYESRYSKKRTVTLTLSIMGPLMLLNFALLFLFGIDKMITLVLVTCSLPSLIFFWILAKHRGGRFLFTFCLSDTITMEFMYLTGILDFYLGGTFVFAVVSRFLIYPVITVLIYKFIRPIYLDVQDRIEKGWYTFAGIGFIFYIVLSLSYSKPTPITERPEALPAFLLLLLLMPLLYIFIFNTIIQQQKNAEAKEREALFQVQVSHMQSRMEELNHADKRFRIERHNFRHKMQTIASLVDTKQYDSLSNLVREYCEAITETQVIRYCDYTIIDATLSSYLQKAEAKDICVTTKIAFPDTLSANETELATVFANAIENAIHACEKLDSHRRHLDIKILNAPCFMIQIRNSFDGNVIFDKHGLPVTTQKGHGYGTRSIVAFCEKYNAYHHFKTEGDLFVLQIVFNS